MKRNKGTANARLAISRTEPLALISPAWLARPDPNMTSPRETRLEQHPRRWQLLLQHAPSIYFFSLFFSFMLLKKKEADIFSAFLAPVIF